MFGGIIHIEDSIMVYRIGVLLLVLTTCVAFSSCGRELVPVVPTANWIAIEKTNFRLLLPETFVEIPVQGVDTLVYQFDSTTSSIVVEYGSYANVSEGMQNRTNFVEETVALGWRSAKIFSYSDANADGKSSNHLVLVLKNVNFSGNNLLALGRFQTQSEKDVIMTAISTLTIK